MKVFIAGAVSFAGEGQLSKYDVYKRILTEMVGDLSLTTPDDIWAYREKCIAENPKATKIEIDNMMTDFDLQRVRESDLLVCDLSVRSTGMGIELGVAHENRVKTIFCFEEGVEISNMITGTFKGSKFICYKDLVELAKKLKKELQNI